MKPMFSFIITLLKLSFPTTNWQWGRKTEVIKYIVFVLNCLDFEKNAFVLNNLDIEYIVFVLKSLDFER